MPTTLPLIRNPSLQAETKLYNQDGHSSLNSLQKIDNNYEQYHVSNPTSKHLVTFEKLQGTYLS